MTTLFQIIKGSTERPILILSGEAADAAIAKLIDGMTTEAIEEKLAAIEWDWVEDGDVSSLNIYINA